MSRAVGNIGTSFGRYRIDALLGAGGMGKVYRAWDPLLQCTVAIKLINEDELADDSSRARILSEARIASALNHPNICTIKDVEEADGHACIVMEYVEGRTLSTLIPENGLPAEMVLRYGVEIADAVAHAHEHGVVHRDLKSGNIVVTEEGRIKLLDFGLSRFLPEIQVPGVSRTRSSSGSRSAAGTLDYVAPEVLRGELRDHRSDIWSLGVLAYEMATGKMPFQGRTDFEVASAILRDPPPPLPPRVPMGLRAIILRSLAKDPSQRYQRSGELRAALQAVQSQLVKKPVGVIPRWVAPIVAALLLMVVSLGFYFFLVHPPLDSVAVLTLVNAAPGPETDYLSEGLTETLMDNLSQTPKLRVYRYTGKGRDAKEVGRELGVRAVVKGGLAQRNDNLSINIELVDTNDDRQLWGTHYERKLSDVLMLQQQISQEISENLRLHLTSGEKQRVTKRYTESNEAYRYYLQGRYYWNKRTQGGLQLAVHYFQEAIQRDPKFALAYTGLADSFAFSTLIGGPEIVPPQQAMPKAKEAAMKALELDDSLAEAHASLGHALHNYDWDWVGAEREFQQAIQLNPNYATAHHWYAHLLMQTGRTQESLVEAVRAQELDPLEPTINNGLGHQYLLARQFDRAIEVCQKTLEIDPNYVPGRILLGLAYEQKGMFREALAEYQRAGELIQTFANLAGNPSAGESPMVEAMLGHAYAMTGRTTEAKRQVTRLKTLASKRYVPPSYLAVVYIALGDKDRAFAQLEQSYQLRSEDLLYLKVEPLVDPLRSDPRFLSLLQRVGLPQ